MKNFFRHNSELKISSGVSSPQGATIQPEGVNFAIFSQYATAVYLLLFDKPGSAQTVIIEIKNKENNIWHVFVHGLKAGQLYAFKVDGKYDPDNGFRFNKNKCLLDPYAKAIIGKFDLAQDLIFAYDTKSTKKDLSIDRQDNSAITPKAIVVDDSFDWQDEAPLNIQLKELIIYEVHLKGFTAHPSSNVQYSGTYLGFIEKIPYLKELGINAVELLPVHESFTNKFLVKKGLKNYWGYDTIGFFAPESSYSTQKYPGCQVTEFKTLVRELHKAGFEIILDVVYNHTGEGNELGATICFRGIDNQTYYALRGTSDKPYRYYCNNAGTGNILNIENPQVLNMVIDSLKYWVLKMHVDGFRFDLATILGLEQAVFKKDGSFFKTIKSDPVFRNTKFIAEPWDVTTYQLGNFPDGWAEWNDKFRDSVRKFLKSDPNQINELARRITGSQDFFGEGRTPNHSINFITCHDGFTLNDLFSFNDKHNQTNGEKNSDGSDDNHSKNCGVEGETKNIGIINFRKQMAKNAICCLLFSMGTPMILAGDEFLRTQKGNNNAYCQDNELSWFNWNMLEKNQDFFSFFKKTIAFRKKYAIFQKSTFFSGTNLNGNNMLDVEWFDTNLKKPKWDDPKTKIICYLLDGDEISYSHKKYCLFFILNADYIIHSVKVPQNINKTWYRIVDTSLKSGDDFIDLGDEPLPEKNITYQSQPGSVVVLFGKEADVDTSYYLG